MMLTSLASRCVSPLVPVHSTPAVPSFKQRDSDTTTIVAVEQIYPTLKAEIARLFTASQQRVVPYPFRPKGRLWTVDLLFHLRGRAPFRC